MHLIVVAKSRIPLEAVDALQSNSRTFAFLRFQSKAAYCRPLWDSNTNWVTGMEAADAMVSWTFFNPNSRFLTTAFRKFSVVSLRFSVILCGSLRLYDGFLFAFLVLLT